MTQLEPREPGGGKVDVIVTDVQIPFGSMVTLLVKLALAAIPALIILGTLALIFAVVFVGLFHR